MTTVFTNLFYTLASLYITVPINYLSFASSSKKYELNSKELSSRSLLIFPPNLLVASFFGFFGSGGNRKIRVYDSRVIVAQSFRVSDGSCALAAATSR